MSGVGARILAVQPRMSAGDLSDPVMATEDPLLMEMVANLIRAWASGRGDLPADFAERVRVTGLSRQPMSFASVDLERAERAAQLVTEPFPPGTAVDASGWATDDPFALRPLPAPSFPAQARQAREAVPGRQTVRECRQCSGAGAAACAACGGAGRVTCSTCHGSRRVVCSQCGGGGSYTGMDGTLVACRNCGQSGAVQCGNCHGRGQLACQPCKGAGTLPCGPCGGFGNLLARWVLITTTDTRHAHEPLLAEPWPVPADALFADADVIGEHVWRPSSSPVGQPLDALGPPAVVTQIRSVLTREQHAAAGERPRVTAVRAQVRGTFVYDVRLDYDGRRLTFLMGGGRSQVFPRYLPPRTDQGAIRSLGRLVRRGMRALATDERPGVSNQFIAAVTAGRVHLADTDLLLPAVAAHLGCKLDVTAEGYQLQVVEAAPRPGPALAVTVELDVDPDGGIVLAARLPLGPARREQYPLALSLNGKLQIGRLAVVDDAAGGEAYAIVDRRPYRFATAAGYTVVLQALAAAARWFTTARPLER